MEETFYLKRVPQSEYRRNHPSEGKSQSHLKILDTVLEDLRLKNLHVKAAVIQKIMEETEKLFSVILPPNIAENIDKEQILAPVFSKLGLR